MYGGLLAGDGRGGFQFRNYPETGFFVEGDARGAAELLLDDRRTLVLVTQNDDSLRVFEHHAPSTQRYVRVQPGDRYAILKLSGGRIRRQEFYDGSTYLSQSSRFLSVTDDVKDVEVFDNTGSRRMPIPTPRRHGDAPPGR